MPVDKAVKYIRGPKDSKVTLYEAYVYAKVMAQSHNPNQTAQIWPENSAFVLWGK